MGSQRLFVETPFSEIAATLEILDRHGVSRDDLRKLRAAPPEVQSQVAHIIKNALTVSRISVTNGDDHIRIRRPPPRGRE